VGVRASASRCQHGLTGQVRLPLVGCALASTPDARLRYWAQLSVSTCQRWTWRVHDVESVEGPVYRSRK